MAVKTFDNQGGAGNGLWETGANWDPDAPGDNDTIVIAADCNVSTDYSAITFEQLTVNSGKTLTIDTDADIRFDTNTCDFPGELLIKGYITFTDITELETNGTVTIDGGTISIVETDDSLARWEMRYHNIVGTANGGMIKLVAAHLDKAQLQLNPGNILADSGNRLIVDGDSGANQGYVLLYADSRFENVDFDGVSNIDTSANDVSFENCLLHNMGTALHPDSAHVEIESCFIYDNTIGLDPEDPCNIICRNTVFSENEYQDKHENTSYDLSLDGCNGVFHNCLFSSTTPFDTISQPVFATFTAYQQDETDWLSYQGVGHYAQPEFGAGAQGGSGTAVKCTVGGTGEDTLLGRFRRLVAVIPATHGDKIDVTLYLKGTNTKTAVLRIDPVRWSRQEGRDSDLSGYDRINRRLVLRYSRMDNQLDGSNDV